MPHELNPVQVGFSRLCVAGLRGLGFVTCRLSPAVWGWLSSLIAPVLWIALAKHRKRALRNLLDSGRSPAEARALGKASFRSNLLVLFESLAMPRLLARKGVRIETTISPEAEAVLERIRTGKEVMAIGISGHMGVWELLGAEMARLIAPVPVVISARLVKNPVIADFLVNLRRSYGMILVGKDGFTRFLLRQFRNKSPHVYVFLCDQHIKGGIPLTFMGRPACTVTMPAGLHLKYNAPVLTGACHRRAPGDYRIELDLLPTASYREEKREDAEPALTEALNDFIGRKIEEVPEQWTWAHRRWRPCCSRDEAGHPPAAADPPAGSPPA